MNKPIGLFLIVYSLLLGGLSYVVYHLAPSAVGRPTLITGLTGGVLCLVWGIRAVAGGGGKALPILTLIPVSFVLLSQTIMSWSGTGGEFRGGWTAAAVISLLLVLSLAMVVRIAWSGVVFDVAPTGASKDERAKPATTGKQATGK